MTERNNGLPPNPDSQALPDGFEMPTDSVLLAEADREQYEGMFVYRMTRTSDNPDELYTPAERVAVIQARIAQIKMLLTSPQYDAQVVIDAIDIDALSKDAVLETSIFDIFHAQTPIDSYQLENALRTGVNALSNLTEPEYAKARKPLIKRYTEAKKMAVERDVPQETVFSDQQLYLELIRRSTSPEELISDTKELIERARIVIGPLLKHGYRNEMLITNADNESVTVEDIDDQTSRFVDRPAIRSESEKSLLGFEDHVNRATQVLIERYWGPETAALFE